MQWLGETLSHITRLVDLTALDWRVGAERAVNHFAQRLGAVDDEQLADRRVEPALAQIIHQRLHHAGVLGCPSTRPSGCLCSSASMPSAATSTQVVADVQTVNLDDQEVQCR